MKECQTSRLPFAVMKAGVLYYMVYDQIGSLKLVADSVGNVVKRIEYDTFGNIISDSAPSFEIPFGFAGGLHDRLTGLVRFGYRDYDPDTGRWTAKDPIGFAGGDTDLYGYCLGDPVNFTDPEGEFAIIPILIGIGLIADVYLNTHFEQGGCPDEYSVNIPPPSTWNRGLPLPFLFGVKIPFTAEHFPIIGIIGIPTGELTVTADPVLAPAVNGIRNPAL